MTIYTQKKLSSHHKVNNFLIRLVEWRQNTHFLNPNSTTIEIPIENLTADLTDLKLNSFLMNPDTKHETQWRKRKKPNQNRERRNFTKSSSFFSSFFLGSLDGTFKVASSCFAPPPTLLGSGVGAIFVKLAQNQPEEPFWKSLEFEHSDESRSLCLCYRKLSNFRN